MPSGSQRFLAAQSRGQLVAEVGGPALRGVEGDVAGEVALAAVGDRELRGHVELGQHLVELRLAAPRRGSPQPSTCSPPGCMKSGTLRGRRCAPARAARGRRRRARPAAGSRAPSRCTPAPCPRAASSPSRGAASPSSRESFQASNIGSMRRAELELRSRPGCRERRQGESGASTFSSSGSSPGANSMVRNIGKSQMREADHPLAELQPLADLAEAERRRRADAARGSRRSRRRGRMTLLGVVHEAAEVVVDQGVHAHHRLRTGAAASCTRVIMRDLPEAAAHHVEELGLAVARADDDLAVAGDDLELERVVGLGAVAEARDAEPGHRGRAGDGDPEVVGQHRRQQAAARSRRPPARARSTPHSTSAQSSSSLISRIRVHRRGVEQHAAGQSTGRSGCAPGCAARPGCRARGRSGSPRRAPRALRQRATAAGRRCFQRPKSVSNCWRSARSKQMRSGELRLPAPRSAALNWVSFIGLGFHRVSVLTVRGHSEVLRWASANGSDSPPEGRTPEWRSRARNRLRSRPTARPRWLRCDGRSKAARASPLVRPTALRAAASSSSTTMSRQRSAPSAILIATPSATRAADGERVDALRALLADHAAARSRR